MTNAEKYVNEILEAVKQNAVCKFMKDFVFEDMGVKCREIPNCDCCKTLFPTWAQKEYKEPEVDWSKVAVDTPILVKDPQKKWRKRYFAKYENGRILTFTKGATSWSAGATPSYSYYTEAKLAESESDNE